MKKFLLLGYISVVLACNQPANNKDVSAPQNFQDVTKNETQLPGTGNIEQSILLNEGASPLLLNGRIDENNFLESFDTDFYEQDKKERLLSLLGTAFLQAVEKNQWQEADRLLNLKVPTIIHYSDRVEPFKKALDTGDIERIKLLLVHDFLQNAEEREAGDSDAIDFSGPIAYAFAQNDANKLKMLAKAGFPLNDPRWISQLLDGQQTALLQEITETQGLPSLQQASFAAYANVVEYLLKNKKYPQEELNAALVNTYQIIQDDDCFHMHEGKNVDGIKDTASILLAYGADVNGTGNRPCYTADIAACTALQEILAVSCLPEETVEAHAKFLLEHGADINVKDSAGNMLLTRIISIGHWPHRVDFLRAHGAKE